MRRSNPTAIAPIQRRCLDALASAWGVTVAHHLRHSHGQPEQHSDGDLNLLGVPIMVFSPIGDAPRHSRARSAVGLLTWDPAKADPAPVPADGKSSRTCP